MGGQRNYQLKNPMAYTLACFGLNDLLYCLIQSTIAKLLSEIRMIEIKLNIKTLINGDINAEYRWN